MSEPVFHTKRLTAEELRVQLDELSKLGVVGFVRFSDAETPVYVDSKSEPLPALPPLPRFLYEAALYAEGLRSVSIRQFNDFWLWNEVEWNGLPPAEDGATQNGLAYSQMALGGKKLRFYTHFLPVQDPGASFPTLRPAWNAFIGFEEGE